MIGRRLALLAALACICCNSARPRSSPDAGAPGAPRAVEIAVGWSHSCARMSDDTVRCWGSNTHGELGAGSQAMIMPARPLPIQVVNLKDAVEIALGANDSCARIKDGTVRCWGVNENGQLGDGTNTDRDTPNPVPGLAGVRRIALGRAEACAILDDGTVRCWGGLIGKFKPLNPQPGPIAEGGTPVDVQGLAGIVAVSLGRAHACALVRDGSVACWGENTKGQLGDGTTETRRSPVRVPGLTDAVDVAASLSSTCALRRGGTVLCWGAAGGEDGAPREIPELAGAAQLAATCARGAGGWVRCLRAGRIDPIETAGAVQIAFGVAHGCLRTAGGEVRCWGANRAGELGDGTRSDRRHPVPVIW